MSTISTKPFGGTGHQSTRVLFGAAALGSVDQDTADRTMESLISFGINHIDVAASYGKGEAEKRLGPWMSKRRDEFFLATKTGERTGEGAKRELGESLERLQTDSVDLIQLHNLVEEDDWATALAPGGALEALVAARDEGLVRFIGVTGHGFSAPKRHAMSLERFPFDSVLLPYNFPLTRVESYAEDFQTLVSICTDRNVAIQTIKSIARRPWHTDRTSTTWYEPLGGPEHIRRAVHWVLANEHVFLNSAGDVTVLPTVLEAAADLPSERPSDEEMQAMVASESMELIFEGDKAKSHA